MARDWSGRTAALAYFQEQLRLSKRCNADDKELLEEAVHALRRSQDHTAIQAKLTAAMRALRKCALVLSGAEPSKQALIDALQETRDVLRESPSTSTTEPT